MKKPEIPWAQTTTLDETVVRLIKHKLTATPEYQAIVAFYGKDRVRNIWLAYQSRNVEKKLPPEKP